MTGASTLGPISPVRSGNFDVAPPFPPYTPGFSVREAQVQAATPMMASGVTSPTKLPSLHKSLSSTISASTSMVHAAAMHSVSKETVVAGTYTGAAMNTGSEVVYSVSPCDLNTGSKLAQHRRRRNRMADRARRRLEAQHSEVGRVEAEASEDRMVAQKTGDSKTLKVQFSRERMRNLRLTRALKSTRARINDLCSWIDQQSVMAKNAMQKFQELDAAHSKLMLGGESGGAGDGSDCVLGLSGSLLDQPSLASVDSDAFGPNDSIKSIELHFRSTETNSQDSVVCNAERRLVKLKQRADIQQELLQQMKDDVKASMHELRVVQNELHDSNQRLLLLGGRPAAMLGKTGDGGIEISDELDEAQLAALAASGASECARRDVPATSSARELPRLDRRGRRRHRCPGHCHRRRR